MQEKYSRLLPMQVDFGSSKSTVASAFWLAMGLTLLPFIIIYHIRCLHNCSTYLSMSLLEFRFWLIIGLAIATIGAALIAPAARRGIKLPTLLWLTIYIGSYLPFAGISPVIGVSFLLGTMIFIYKPTERIGTILITAWYWYFFAWGYVELLISGVARL